MAKYRGSIYGSISGQQLGSVGASWKGVNYVREYVIPNNPKTVAQTLQRTIFSNVCQFLRKLVSSVLNPYWLPAPKKMSAFNAAMALNVPLQSAAVLDPSKIKITQGSLFNPGMTVSSLTPGAGLIVNYATTLVGDALGTDVAHVAVYDSDAQVFRYGSALRSAGGVVINNADAGTMKVGDAVYLFFVNAASTASSDSDYAALTPAP